MRKLINGENQIQKLDKIRQKIKQLQCEESILVQKSITHIERYGKLEQGNWNAVIDIMERRCPKWKEEFIAECGLRKADEVIQNTPISVCKKVNILYRGVKVA